MRLSECKQQKLKYVLAFALNGTPFIINLEAKGNKMAITLSYNFSVYIFGMLIVFSFRNLLELLKGKCQTTKMLLCI